MYSHGMKNAPISTEVIPLEGYRNNCTYYLLSGEGRILLRHHTNINIDMSITCDSPNARRSLRAADFAGLTRRHDDDDIYWNLYTETTQRTCNPLNPIRAAQKTKFVWKFLRKMIGVSCLHVGLLRSNRYRRNRRHMCKLRIPVLSYEYSNKQSF
jgi:hypothetical protein